VIQNRFYIKKVPSFQITEARIQHLIYCIKPLHEKHGLGINFVNLSKICDKRSVQLELLHNRLWQSYRCYQLHVAIQLERETTRPSTCIQVRLPRSDHDIAQRLCRLLLRGHGSGNMLKSLLSPRAWILRSWDRILLVYYVLSQSVYTLLGSLCPFVCPHGTMRLTQDGFT